MSGHHQFANISFREIHKNAWLKRLSTSKKRRERLWIVFCVHDDADAFLESYSDNKLAVLHKPEWSVHLNEVQHVSPAICPTEDEYEFALTLRSEVVRLTAPSWHEMADWVASLQAKLHELRILSPKDNVYSKLPEKNVPVPRTPLLQTTRDPNSPLPPPPATSPEVLPGTELLQVTPQEIPQTSSFEEVFRFDDVSNSVQEISPEVPNNCVYERLFQGVPGPSNLQQPPLPYKTFREQQVLQLQKEMSHSSGVKLQLRKKDCISSIALVDAFDSVWICGWKQKEHPMLYNVLHIGDKILTVAGIPVKKAAEFYRIVDSRYCGLYVDIVLKRIPHGHIFLIHRDSEGQPLGIIQEQNTAVIESVEPESLAARYGLSTKARTCDGLSFTNWVLTEINGRPLNLFFKKTQVRDRLNCVGRDISILVQPLDLIKQLKKELKSLRNYKDYILQ